MVNDPNDNSQGIRKIRAINMLFEVKDDSLVVLEKDGPEYMPAGIIRFSEIKDISIKPAGTLFDGEVVISLKSGGRLKYGIKKFHQEDFEELKKQLGK